MAGEGLLLVYIPSESPLEKTNFSFFEWLAIGFSFLLGMGVCVHSVSTGAPSGSGPVHAATISVSFYVSWFCYVSKALFP